MTFSTTIQLLTKTLKPLIVFYPHSKICKNQPKEYINYSRLKYIIGRSKLFIEKPSDLNNQAATWRDYKDHNTNKFQGAITPQGCIAFISYLYGGRTSDQFIVKDNKFLDDLSR